MIDNSLIKEYKQLDTALISDAMEELGIPGGLLGIDAVIEGKKICGEAFTVHYIPAGLKKPAVGDYFDKVEAGQVVVIDNSGRLDCGVWGDITTKIAMIKKYEATVIDGATRDVQSIRKSDFPVFAKGKSMVSGKRHVLVDTVQVPISCAGMLVCPGDLIFGDDTGVISIPRAKIEEVLNLAKKLQKEEQKVIEKLREKR